MHAVSVTLTHALTAPPGDRVPMTCPMTHPTPIYYGRIMHTTTLCLIYSIVHGSWQLDGPVNGANLLSNIGEATGSILSTNMWSEGTGAKPALFVCVHFQPACFLIDSVDTSSSPLHIHITTYLGNGCLCPCRVVKSSTPVDKVVKSEKNISTHSRCVRQVHEPEVGQQGVTSPADSANSIWRDLWNARQGSCIIRNDEYYLCWSPYLYYSHQYKYQI